MAYSHEFGFGEVLEIMFGFLSFAPQWIDINFFILVDLSREDFLLVVFEHFSLELLLCFPFQVEELLILFGGIWVDDIGSLER